MWPNVGAPRTMAAVIPWTWVGPGSHPGSSTVQNASSSTPAGSITPTATSTIRSRDAENPVVSTSMTANPDRKESSSFIATTVDRGCDGGHTLVAHRIGVGSATHHGRLYAVVTPEECLALAATLDPLAALTVKPLVAGLDPDLGWASLELFVDRVVPALA